MSVDTQPVFIVSSGRSGTQMCHKLLSTFHEVEAHHEYMCTHVQPLAVLHYIVTASHDTAVKELTQLHSAAVFYSEADVWIDASNKLSWLIRPLLQLFPSAKFIHLVRDGRKVASSFFHKLGEEIYDDRSVSILKAYLAEPDKHACPPPEKKYWWNRPVPGHPLADTFGNFDQFQRICFHWAEVHRVILRDLEQVPAEQQLTVKLEDLVACPEQTDKFLRFLGLRCTDYHVALLQRPHNVHVPQDYSLNERQREQFWKIAGDMMRRFGYHETPEYSVAY